MNLSDLYIWLKDPDRLDENSLPVLKSVTEQFPVFQAGWVLLLKNLKKLNSPDFEAYLEKGAFYITDRRQLFLFLTKDKTDTQTEETLKILSREYISQGTYHLEKDAENPDSLSDLVKSLRHKQFVKENDQSQMEESHNSESAGNDFVTETLAKIYVKQKLYKEALQAYEKLSLKFPEKNVYFAGQIEEVKKLMN